MAVRGRKPTPTALKKLHGNPGKRPLPKGEPKPPAVDAVPAPRHLNAVAAAEWHRLVVQFRALGIFSTLDAGLLESYCISYGRAVKAERRLARTGGEVITNVAGNLVDNPWARVSQRERENMRKLAAEFGMSPASRPRIGREAADPLPQGAPTGGVDSFDAYLASHPRNMAKH